jgi:hypothetical protein
MKQNFAAAAIASVTIVGSVTAQQSDKPPTTSEVIENFFDDTTNFNIFSKRRLEHSERLTQYLLSLGKDKEKPKNEQSFSQQEIFITLEDFSLLRVREVNGKLFFARTCPGYAQAGAGIDLRIAGIGAEARAKIPVSDLFFNINPREALAFLNNDWVPLYNEAIKQKRIGISVLDPEKIRLVLGLYAIKPEEETPTATSFKASANTENVPARTAALHEIEIIRLSDKMWDDKFLNSCKSISLPIYIKMKDGTLMRMVEEKDTKGNGTLIFSKTAVGYAQWEAELEVNTLVLDIGGGVSIPDANIYNKLTPKQVMAFFDGDWEKIYKQALWNRLLLGDASPNPYTVMKELKPLSTHPKGEVQVINLENTTVILGPHALWVKGEKDVSKIEADIYEVRPYEIEVEKTANAIANEYISLKGGQKASLDDYQVFVHNTRKEVLDFINKKNPDLAKRLGTATIKETIDLAQTKNEVVVHFVMNHDNPYETGTWLLPPGMMGDSATDRNNPATMKRFYVENFTVQQNCMVQQYNDSTDVQELIKFHATPVGPAKIVQTKQANNNPAPVPSP